MSQVQPIERAAGLAVSYSLLQPALSLASLPRPLSTFSYWLSCVHYCWPSGSQLKPEKTFFFKRGGGDTRVMLTRQQQQRWRRRQHLLCRLLEAQFHIPIIFFPANRGKRTEEIVLPTSYLDHIFILKKKLEFSLVLEKYVLWNCLSLQY